MKILTWQARNNKKVTLVKLSKITGISKSTLNNIENEKVSPTIAEGTMNAVDHNNVVIFDDNANDTD